MHGELFGYRLGGSNINSFRTCHARMWFMSFAALTFLLVKNISIHKRKNHLKIRGGVSKGEPRYMGQSGIHEPLTELFICNYYTLRFKPSKFKNSNIPQIFFFFFYNDEDSIKNLKHQGRTGWILFFFNCWVTISVSQLLSLPKVKLLSSSNPVAWMLSLRWMLSRCSILFWVKFSNELHFFKFILQSLPAIWRL